MQTKEASGQSPEVTPNLESQINSLRSNGQSLPESVRNYFEPRFGYDFSNVRLHTDLNTGKMSNAINAKAFTIGRDVVFGAGQYLPEAESGKRLLAHELTHVVQQGQGMHAGQIQRACGQSAIAAAVGTRSGCTDLFDGMFASGSSPFKFKKSCDEFAPGQSTALISFVSGLPATATLEIHSFASIDGLPDFNKNLGCARALAARKLLTDPPPLGAGIAASRITGIINHGPVPGSATDRRSVVIRTTTPTPPPPVVPAVPPIPANKCGPDITSALTGVLSSVDSYFHGLGSWFRKRRSCMVLDVDFILSGVNPIMAWDIRELYLPNTGFLDPYFRSRGCGSPRDPGCDTDSTRHLCETAGTCGNTVVVGGKCMLAGTANYAIYGKMFKLCHDEFSPDYPRWDMRAMITLWKTLDRDDPEPPKAMASSVFDGTFPSVPSVAENRGFCTGRCGISHGGSFGFVWEPYHPR